RRRIGDTDHDALALQEGTPTDEANASENTRWQVHEVVHDERIGRASRGPRSHTGRRGAFLSAAEPLDPGTNGCSRSSGYAVTLGQQELMAKAKMNAVEMLKADHRKVEELFERYITARGKKADIAKKI